MLVVLVIIGNLVLIALPNLMPLISKAKDPKGLYIDGEGAVPAVVTVYGPGGDDDIQQYTGFTMTSDYELFGAIAEGIYIHATNNDGKAGGTMYASTGCLLIQGGKQWTDFNTQNGKREFKLILNRSK